MDNLLSKLTRLHVEERSFTPDGSNDPIRYNIAILSIELKGQPQTNACGYYRPLIIECSTFVRIDSWPEQTTPN